MRFARRRTINGVVAVTLAISAVCRAATLHVPADYPTIQACINAAVSGVDECVVAPGTYNETINFLGKAVTLRSSGGADVTTIDATGIGGSVVTCASGEGLDTILEGFTITGGRGTDVNTDGYTYGGGMYNYQSSPTVSNCAFKDNSSANGGGMYNGVSSPTVRNCTFSANTATSGGGMYNFGSSPTVTSCTFNNNDVASFSPPYSTASGGGMCNIYSSPTVTYCTFNNNAAFASPVDHPGTGGGMCNYDSSTTVTHCKFNGNGAYGGGGGMSNGGSNPTVTDCTFSGNWAAIGGGGMENGFSNPSVTHCMFSGNLALEYGGGMYNGGGTPTVTDCTFSGNTAHTIGGGMYNVWGSPTVINCTFSGNWAANGGGGMVNDSSSLTVTNCVLWGDTPSEIVNVQVFESTIAFCDVQSGLPVGAVDGGGNINVAPMFIRPPNPGPDGTWNGVADDYGDLRLRGGSRCINAGDPLFVAQPGETDLDGHARVLCEYVDMGAYEFGIGDFDCDQSVDMSDFSSWPDCMSGPSAAEWRMTNGEERMTEDGRSAIGMEDSRFEIADACPAFDFDADGDVDLRDLAGFQRVFAGQ